MCLSMLSVFRRSQPAFRKAYSGPCFPGRLCLFHKPSAVIKRLTSSSGSALQPQEESRNEKESGPDIQVIDSSSSVRKPGLLHEIREATYYHGIMENLPIYQMSVFSKADLQSLLCENQSDILQILERKDWSAVSIEELLDAFRILTSHAVKNNLPISMPQFDSICFAIVGRMPEFSDDDFLKIGKLHTLWPFSESPTAKNYKLFYKRFDDSCCARYQAGWYSSRQMTKILQASDIFYWQRLGSFSHYLRLSIYHCARKIREPHHMIQMMFYLGLLKSVPRTYKFYDLEKKLYSFKDYYSLPELGIVLNAFFRTKSRLQYYPLMQDLLEKSLDAVPTLDDNLLITISKGLHFAPKELLPQLKLFQTRLLAKLCDLNMISSVHALWMFGSNHILEPEFGDALYEKALKEISNLRTKELTRLITVFTEHKSPKRDMKRFAESTVTELQKPAKSIWLRRKPFIQGAALHRLLICGVCPDDLVNQYLSSVDSAKTSNEALGVDIHLEVFHPNYCGARLRHDLREEIYKYRFEDTKGEFVKSCGAMGKRSTFNLRSVQFAEDVVLEVVEGKEDHLLIKRLVPSFGYLDIILHFGEKGGFLPIPECMRKTKPWELTRIPLECVENGSKFIAVTFIPKMSEFADKNLTCFQNEKKAILGKLGFITLEVSVSQWKEMDVSEMKTQLVTKIAEIVPLT